MTETSSLAKVGSAPQPNRIRATRLWQVPRKLMRNPETMVGLLIIVGMIICAVAAPLVAPTGFDDQLPQRRLLAPGETYEGTHFLLGTDQLGRDMLSRIIYGARVSLLMGTLGVLIGGTIGVIVGLTAGWFGGWTDTLLMRLADIQLAFPYLLLAIAVVAVLGTNLIVIVSVLSLGTWVIFARVVRGSVFSIKTQEYVEAARVSGSNTVRIVILHVLPNVAAPIIVLATVEFASLILLEATLSFLGLGVQPPFPSWGRMLDDGRTYLQTAWWLGVFPGVAIMFAVLGANLLGDGLRDALDPRVK